MFVDEKKQGEAQTKADPFEITSLIAWLEKQPAGKRYDYYNPCVCAVAQYARYHGMHFDDVNPTTNWSFLVAAETPRTFGAALERARNLQART